MREHDIVYLIDALPSEGLAANQSGTIVHIYPDGETCEIEFQGYTRLGKNPEKPWQQVVTLPMNKVRK